MQTGTKISGAAHFVLVGAAIFGGAFNSEPLPFEVQNVSVITVEQFAAMTASTVPPAVAAQPVALTRPDPENETPEVAAQTDPAPDQVPPEPTAQPVPDEEPEIQPDQPAPQTEAVDTAPTLVPPQPEVEILPQEVSPQPETQPELRPVDRVAPVPVVAPPPDTTPDEVETPQVDPDQGEELPQEPSEATAPQEANDRIVTEADNLSTLAPTRSARPPARPARRPATPPATPIRQAEQVDTSEPTPDTQAGVNDALAEALGTPATPMPSGPPLSGGEKEGLRAAVSKCWNVGSLSSAALQTTVVVGVSMTRQGKPETGTIRLLSSSGGPEAAAKQAFETARRAIIRCGSRGYDLPVEKYAQWREIEMTFNPERMRIK